MGCKAQIEEEKQRLTFLTKAPGSFTAYSW